MTLFADERYYIRLCASNVSIKGISGINYNAAGQWNVSGKILMIRDANGSIRDFQINQARDELLLNQKRRYREGCRCQ